MHQSTELATFRGDDEPCLVQAALACRVCLSGEVHWSLRVDEWDAQVECACRSCGDRRTVSLNSQQALRLYLHRSQTLAG
jgi:hypothetical protein